MTEDEAEMDFIIEWVIRFEVKETLRGWYKHMEKRYGICQPDLAQLRCRDLGLIRVRPLR